MKEKDLKTKHQNHIIQFRFYHVFSSMPIVKKSLNSLQKDCMVKQKTRQTLFTSFSEKKEILLFEFKNFKKVVHSTDQYILKSEPDQN